MDANNQLELSPGTLRQRRNLSITAIILILNFHADITIGKEIQLQSLSLNVGDPEKLRLFLYVALVYFVWRFYLYFSSDKAYGYVKNQYQELRDGILNRAVVKEIFRAHPKIDSLTGSYEYSKLQSNGTWYYKINAEASRTKEDHPSGKFDVRNLKLRIEFPRLIALWVFLLRGRILTDYYLPFLLALYALALYFV